MSKLEDDIIARGRAAWDRLRRDQSWNDYMETAEALAVGRDHCLAVTHANDLDDKLYRNEFGKWLEANGLAESQHGPDKTIRSLLFKCLRYRSELEAARRTMTQRQRLSINAPASMLRYWYNHTAEGKAAKAAEEAERPERKRAARQEQRDQDASEIAFAKLKEQISKVGDWDFEKAATIADKLQDNYPALAAEVSEIIAGSGERSSGLGIDWETDEELLAETLLALLPLTARINRVLQQVVARHGDKVSALAQPATRKPRGKVNREPAGERHW